jgi:hypothetical protein
MARKKAGVLIWQRLFLLRCLFFFRIPEHLWATDTNNATTSGPIKKPIAPYKWIQPRMLKKMARVGI